MRNKKTSTTITNHGYLPVHPAKKFLLVCGHMCWPPLVDKQVLMERIQSTTSFDTTKNLMIAGMVLWYATATPWLAIDKKDAR